MHFSVQNVLRTAFAFWQEGYSIAEDLQFSRVLDHDKAEERPYKSRKTESASQELGGPCGQPRPR